MPLNLQQIQDDLKRSRLWLNQVSQQIERSQVWRQRMQRGVNPANPREKIALRFLFGDGIEVGALHSPLKVPDDVTVRYVDRLSVADLREQYPELASYDLVEVDIIDDGETLMSIADQSLDFVIANQVIEHCQNPIGTLERYLQVLKPGGVIYLGVPDKRYTFDCDRPETEIDHLLRDYREGGEWSKLQHFEEWVKYIDKAPDDQFQSRLEHFLNMNYSIHFHVWTQEKFLELVSYCQTELEFPFSVEHTEAWGYEFVLILRKSY